MYLHLSFLFHFPDSFLKPPNLFSSYSSSSSSFLSDAFDMFQERISLRAILCSSFIHGVQIRWLVQSSIIILQLRPFSRHFCTSSGRNFRTVFCHVTTHRMCAQYLFDWEDISPRVWRELEIDLKFNQFSWRHQGWFAECLTTTIVDQLW